MATGKTHDFVTLWLLIPVFMLGHWLIGLDVYASGLLTLGCLAGGLLLSPDLDTRSRPFYRWGPFRIIWRPYQWMVRHRSPLSHGVLIAPFFRLAYLTAVLLLGYLALSAALNAHISLNQWRYDVLVFLRGNIPAFLVFAVGIWAGCLLHVILDGLSSGFSRKGKRR